MNISKFTFAKLGHYTSKGYFQALKDRNNNQNKYGSGTVNSKSFVGKVLLNRSSRTAAGKGLTRSGWPIMQMSYLVNDWKY